MSVLRQRAAPKLPWTRRPSYPWFRLGISLLLTTAGSCGMYVVVVVLPDVQAEFGTARSGASLPYTLTMLGFGGGGLLMGRLSDRLSVLAPVLLGAVCLAVGFWLAAQTGTVLAFSLASLLIGIGSSATFVPLVADTSLWFTRHRGIAVAICASGNYLSGTVWPPIVQHFADAAGWRPTYVGIGLFCLATSLSLGWLLRPRPPALESAPAPAAGAAPGPAQSQSFSAGPDRPLGLSRNGLQRLLCLAGIGCCTAMAMPQVHIVALCTDLGYGTERGAQMLSVMLGFGIVSRLLSGWISDRIGGPRTLLLGAVLQAVALALFLPNQSVDILFLVSALFGLFQGGIVPAYAIIVREYFPPAEVGTRVALAITATLVGMAFGGWASGAIFDLTGSYDAAFLHGIAWNFLTIAIALFLVVRSGPGLRLASA